MIDKPLMYRGFSTLRCPEISRGPSVADYDKSHFSLGIVLIELALGFPIEDRRMNAEVSSKTDPPSCEPMVANRPYGNKVYKTAN